MGRGGMDWKGREGKGMKGEGMESVESGKSDGWMEDACRSSNTLDALERSADCKCILEDGPLWEMYLITTLRSVFVFVVVFSPC